MPTHTLYLSRIAEAQVFFRLLPAHHITLSHGPHDITDERPSHAKKTIRVKQPRPPKRLTPTLLGGVAQRQEEDPTHREIEQLQTV